MGTYTIRDLEEVEDSAPKFGMSPAPEAGEEGLGYVVFGAPATEPGDAEITPGWWPDAGQGTALSGPRA